MLAKREVEANRVLSAFPIVELFQLRPQPRDLDAHGGVGLGIEVRASAESFGGNRVLADRLSPKVRQVLQERTQHRRLAERLTGEHPLKGSLDRRRFGRLPGLSRRDAVV